MAVQQKYWKMHFGPQIVCFSVRNFGGGAVCPAPIKMQAARKKRDLQPGARHSELRINRAGQTEICGWPSKILQFGPLSLGVCPKFLATTIFRAGSPKKITRSRIRPNNLGTSGQNGLIIACFWLKNGNFGVYEVSEDYFSSSALNYVFLFLFWASGWNSKNSFLGTEISEIRPARQKVRFRGVRFAQPWSLSIHPHFVQYAPLLRWIWLCLNSVICMSSAACCHVVWPTADVYRSHRLSGMYVNSVSYITVCCIRRLARHDIRYLGTRAVYLWVSYLLVLFLRNLQQYRPTMASHISDIHSSKETAKLIPSIP